MKKTAAVICAKGIGDGLMMMVASHRLYTFGYHTATYHDLLSEMANWFPSHTFKNQPIDSFEELTNYDLIVLQNDNSEKAKAIIDLYQQGHIQNLSIFYPSYEPNKHSPLTSWDIVFDKNICMVENIAQSIAKLLRLKHHSKNNGILPPEKLIHRKYKKRVILHPTSTTQLRTWSSTKFIKVAKWLKSHGLTPVFALSKSERPHWEYVEQLGIQVPHFDTLAHLSAYVYESGFVIGNESGVSHLASNLQVPTIVICGNYKRIKLWRPGWLMGKVLTPPTWIPNFKGSRLRENKWQHFIYSWQVHSAFKELSQKDRIKIF